MTTSPPIHLHRRELLQRSGAGLAMLGLCGLLGDESAARESETVKTAFEDACTVGVDPTPRPCRTAWTCPFSFPQGRGAAA